MFWTWLIVMILMLLIEAISFNLVTIWFAIGAIAAMITSLFTNNVDIQTAVFLVISIIMIATLRPFVNKVLKPKIIKTNLDNVIGKVGIVTEDINDTTWGEVKVEGKRWTAISNNYIKIGSKVEILSIEGVKLKVKEVKEEQE